MRRKRHTDSDDAVADIDMTPMMDIVFIMLIFFIVTTSFVKESGIEVNRPSAETAEQQKRGNIIVALKSNNEIWIDKRTVEVHQVRAHIERLRAEQPEGTVIISADKASSTGKLVEVMDQIRAAGVRDAAIATASG